jgi:hypothetical protein
MPGIIYYLIQKMKTMIQLHQALPSLFVLPQPPPQLLLCPISYAKSILLVPESRLFICLSKDDLQAISRKLQEYPELVFMSLQALLGSVDGESMRICPWKPLIYSINLDLVG